MSNLRISGVFGIGLAMLFALAACEKKQAGTTTTTGAEKTEAPKTAEAPKAAEPKAAEPSCDVVVAKLMSLQSTPAGAAEKKLFEKMCAGMDAQRKACIVSSATLKDVQSKCGDGKPF